MYVTTHSVNCYEILMPTYARVVARCHEYLPNKCPVYNSDVWLF